MCFFFKLIMTPSLSFFFFFNDTATTEIYTLSLHDALPICGGVLALVRYQRRDHLGVPARLRPHFEHARIRANAEEQQRLLGMAVAVAGAVFLRALTAREDAVQPLSGRLSRAGRRAASHQQRAGDHTDRKSVV